LILLAGAVWAADPAPVVRPVASGVVVNWTSLALEAEASARGHGTEDTEAIEQLARREVDLAMRQGADRVQLAEGVSFADLSDDPALGDALASRLPRWEVAESRYYTSGRVELLARLSLQELLKPYTLAQARPAIPDDGARAGPTGLLIDARGTEVTPSWSPRVITPEGAEILVVRMWDDDAVNAAPLVWVTDPADGAAARAGASPLIVRAAGAQDTALVVSGEDATALRGFAAARPLGQGRVVVVVDP
jgi:hypothetical protein